MLFFLLNILETLFQQTFVSVTKHKKGEIYETGIVIGAVIARAKRMLEFFKDQVERSKSLCDFSHPLTSSGNIHKLNSTKFAWFAK